MSAEQYYLLTGRVVRVTHELNRRCRTVLFMCAQCQPYDAETCETGNTCTNPLVFVRDNDCLGIVSPMYVQDLLVRDLHQPQQLRDKDAAKQMKRIESTDAPLMQLVRFYDARCSSAGPILKRTILNSIVTQADVMRTIRKCVGGPCLSSLNDASNILTAARVEAETALCVYRTLADSYAPRGLARMATHLTPSSLVSCSLPELAYVQALTQGAMQTRLHLEPHVIALLAQFLPDSPVRTDLQPAHWIVVDPSVKALARFHAILKRSRSTCGKFSWDSSQQPFIDTVHQCGGVLVPVDIEADVYTTGRDSHNEQQCAAQLAIREHVKLLAWRGDPEPMLEALREQLKRLDYRHSDVLFVAPTPSHALMAARFGIPASCTADVCVGRFWKRQTLRVVCVLWAHQFGAETFSSVLSVLPQCTSVVCVGDPYPYCGAAQPYDRGSPFRDCWAAWRQTEADRCEEFFFQSGTTVQCGPMDATVYTDFLARESILCSSVYELCTDAAELPSGVSSLPQLAAVSSEYWAWKLAGRQAADRHRVQRWLAFDDLGEVRAVKQLYTCVAFPPNNEPIAAKTHMICINRGASLHTRFLYALLEPGTEPGIDHRTCCGTNSPNLCSIEVHLAHVHPADVLTAQVASHCSVGPIADELVLHMPPNDAYDGPEPTVDDIHAALRLCRRKLWILCPKHSRPDELLASTLERRGRRPYTQLVSILQRPHTVAAQTLPQRQHELPLHVLGLHYHSIGRITENSVADSCIGRSDRQLVTSVKEFARGTTRFLLDRPDCDSGDEFGGPDVCSLDEGAESPQPPPSTVSRRGFPPVFHCLSRRALDSMTLHELDAHIDGRLAALHGGSLAHYPPNNYHLNRISSAVSGIDDISLAERESVGVAALCMAVRSLNDAAERWLVDAEAELFKRRFAIIQGPISATMALSVYADNASVQSALRGTDEVANACVSVHCERIGQFIQWLPSNFAVDADEDDALFLTKIASVRESLCNSFV